MKLLYKGDIISETFISQDKIVEFKKDKIISDLQVPIIIKRTSRFLLVNLTDIEIDDSDDDVLIYGG